MATPVREQAGHPRMCPQVKWEVLSHLFHRPAPSAGNMGLRLPHGTNLFRTTKCNVMLVDYRGYGLSEGKPSEAGLALDAEAVLETLRRHPKVDR
jgi:fermentation-respiration switch protein FrsA (DUF1100 family)